MTTMLAKKFADAVVIGVAYMWDWLVDKLKP